MNTLEINAHAEYASVPNPISTEIVVMLSLRAPEREIHNRAPLHLVAVLDQSSSLAGAKLRLVKDTLDFFISQLDARDTLCVVGFDSEVRTCLPPTAMNPEGRRRASNGVESLDAHGWTCLSGGLSLGMSELASHLARIPASEHGVATLMLFTDGEANRGITSIPGILNTIPSNPPFTINTFGYGTSNPQLLAGIAQATAGTIEPAVEPVPSRTCSRAARFVTIAMPRTTLPGTVLENRSATTANTRGTAPLSACNLKPAMVVVRSGITSRHARRPSVLFAASRVIKPAIVLKTRAVPGRVPKREAHDPPGQGGADTVERSPFPMSGDQASLVMTACALEGL